MRILHLSDLHGRAFTEAVGLVQRTQPDWVVLTGDMVDDPEWLPGSHRRGARQMRQWTRARNGFMAAPCTTLVRGNHEREGFSDPELQAARPAGFEGRIGVLEGIPAEFGPWGFPREWGLPELTAELEGQGERDLWLSHVPPFGILDCTRHGHRVGHRPLADLIAGPRPPSLVLCGHVHESFGIQTHGRTHVVNAAGGYALLEWDPDSGRMDLQAMEILVRYRPWVGFLEALRPMPG